MHEFSQEQLNEIAAQSQANVETIWQMFGLPEPIPQVNAGLAWAVMTAGLSGGWVQRTPPASMDDLVGQSVAEISEKVEEFLMQVALFEGPESEEPEELAVDDDLINDVYSKGYADGQRAIQEKLQPDRGVRLVTMSAPADTVAETTANGSEGDGELALAFESELAALGKHNETYIAEQERLANAAEEQANNIERVAELIGGGVVASMEGVAQTVPAPATSTHARIETGEERQAALRSILLDLQEMASGNVMPSQKMWDEKKPSQQPTAEMIMLRFDITWQELAKRAHLEYVNRGGRPAKR